jgi:hypothetical protein
MAAKINKKGINNRAEEMENGWEQGAPGFKFRKISLGDLKAKRAEIEIAEQEPADLKAQAKLKDEQIDDMYRELDDMMVEVGEGVRGHDDFGRDSPLYGLMGFIRKSLQKSGLTRKNKNKTEGDNK